MSDPGDFRGLWAYLKKIAIEPVWALVSTGVAVTILYVGTWWRDNFASDEWVKRLQLKNILPHWHPAWWVSIGLAVILFVVVRSSYRVYKECADDAFSLRKQLYDSQFDPLPTTAPLVRLIADSEPDLGPIDRLQLINVSMSQVIFNIVFQPAQLDNGVFVVWNPNTVDVLEPGERVILNPLVLATKDGSQLGACDSVSGVAALHQSIRSRSKASNGYDIGKIAFSCEDAGQLRYLVTIKATLNLMGNRLTVTDLDRIRIGSRPSAQSRD